MPKHGRKGLDLALPGAESACDARDSGRSIKCLSAGRRWGAGSQLPEHTRAQQGLGLYELTPWGCHRAPCGCHGGPWGCHGGPRGCHGGPVGASQRAPGGVTEGPGDMGDGPCPDGV